MSIEPLVPQLVQPKHPKPASTSKALVTDEGKIAAQISNLPSPREMKQIAAAVAAKAAKDILLGNLTFRNAGEAAKVARDFAAVAKDFDWDNEKDSLMKADSVEDRKDSLEAFRQRAQENMKDA